MALDFRKDIVAGAVEDALERGDAIAGDAFAQDGVDGDAAGDAGLHGDVDSSLDGAVPNACAIESHEFLVGGDDGFFGGNGSFNDLAGDGDAADEFGDDVDIGVGYQFAPVGRLMDGAEGWGEGFFVDGAAANGFHLQTEAELLGDFGGVFGKDGERTGAYVAKAHNPNIYMLHAMDMITMRGVMKLRRTHLMAMMLAVTGVCGAAQQREEPPPRLPDGRSQTEAILKADHEKMLKDAGELLRLAEDLKMELEKNDRHVVSVGMLKKTEKIEKLAKRIRSRLTRN